KLKHPFAQVNSVGPACSIQIMRFIVVIKHPDWFIKPTQGNKKLNSLCPRNCAIIIVMHHKQGRVNIRSRKQRRVFYVLKWFFPERSADSALLTLILEHPNHAGLPPDTTISICHVTYRSTCHGSCKKIRMSDQISNLVTSPTLTLNANVFIIDEGKCIDQILSTT